ncbi:MAG: hypothetical protein ACI39R_02400 [Lachnospiraceae bacterium]
MINKVANVIGRDLIFAILIIVSSSLSFFLVYMGISQKSLDEYKINSCTDSAGDYIEGSDISYDEYNELTNFGEIGDYINIILDIYIISVCIFFTYIWFLRRYNEFAIRKAFGQRALDIFVEVFGDMFFIYIIGILIGEIVFLIYALLRTEDVMLISKIPINQLTTFGVVLLPIIITSSVFYIRIKKLSPAKVLSKKTF